jgi:hypothetical protein
MTCDAGILQGLQASVENNYGGQPLLRLSWVREVGKAQRYLQLLEVERAREAGYTWREIGLALGVTQQAAQKLYVARCGVLVGQAFGLVAPEDTLVGPVGAQSTVDQK